MSRSSPSARGGASISGLYGSLVALLVALCFAGQSVTLRRYHSVEMAPSLIVGGFGIFIVVGLTVGLKPISLNEMLILAAMGTVQLALPLVLYMRGARYVPAVQMVLISLADAFLNPFWVWLVHSEVPSRQRVPGRSAYPGRHRRRHRAPGDTAAHREYVHPSSIRETLAKREPAMKFEKRQRHERDRRSTCRRTIRSGCRSTDEVQFRPLMFDCSNGAWSNVLKVTPGGSLACHYHTAPGPCLRAGRGLALSGT